MSRLAKKPLQIPQGVEVKQTNDGVLIKGKKGEFTMPLHEAVKIEIEGQNIKISAKHGKHPMVGTTLRLMQNHIKGVNEGFNEALDLVGVGYRAKVQANNLELSLGFSHPVQFNDIPKGITVESPANTEIILKGSNKEALGALAAKIRAKRPPECYKGKGVKYRGEKVNIKEAKKK